MRDSKELIRMNKTVFITGGLGLLGRTFAKGLLDAGYNVIIGDISSFVIEALEDGLKEYYVDEQLVYCELDITNDKSICNALETALERFKKVDVLINNAYPRNKQYGFELLDVTYDSFCENISMNLGGYFNVSKIFSKHFMDVGSGNIINIASVYGVIAPRFEIYNKENFTMPIEYSVIKSGLIHMSKYMSKYLRGKNIRVNCLSPGGIFDSHSAQFTDSYKNYCLNKGLLNPSDLMGTLLFLVSPESQFINGQNICVDDGFTL